MQNGSQDKYREQREFRDRNQFKSNWKLYENKREGGDTENKKVGSFCCGSRSPRISQCDKKDKPDRMHIAHCGNNAVQEGF